MALYDRLCGYGYPRIPIHQLMASMREYVRSKVTAAQVRDMFSLDAGEQAEVQTLYTAIMQGNSALSTSGTQAANRWQRSWEVEEVLCLGEGRRAPYDSLAAVKTRLGV